MILNVYRTHAGTAVTGFWDAAARRSFFALLDERGSISVASVSSIGSPDIYLSRDHVNDHLPAKVIEEIKAAAHSFELSA